MRIWAKVHNEEKIVIDTLFNYGSSLTSTSYEKYLVDICHILDIPTPITLKYHYKCFDKFNMVKYSPQDFIEPVPFTNLVIENCIDK